MNTIRCVPLMIVSLGMAMAQNSVLAQAVLFFDDFNGPTLNPVFQASLPNGAPHLTYLGAPNFTFGMVDGASVLRLTTILNNRQRVGWNTSTAFAATDFRYEVRFNSLVQSPSTSIDSFIEAWLIDAANSARIVVTGPHGGSYGLDRAFQAGDSLGGQYSGSAISYSYADNTWYRLVIQATGSQNIRASLFADDGTTELVGQTLAYNASAFPNGFQIGLAQSVGVPNGAYPVDVAIDWVRLTTSGLLGDYNHNGIVDAADYTIWRETLGSTTNLAADGNGNGMIDAGDYDVWTANFGIHSGSGASVNAAVPEPATLVLASFGLPAIVLAAVRSRVTSGGKWSCLADRA